VALSMEEQRMLDEMERALAEDDPRLASRLNAFGEQRPPGVFSSQRAKTISGLLALVLITAVAIMMFVLSPYASHHGTPPRTTPSAGPKSPGAKASSAKASGIRASNPRSGAAG
jgi:Protein of unknown function (DUF3040)